QSPRRGGKAPHRAVLPHGEQPSDHQRAGSHPSRYLHRAPARSGVAAPPARLLCPRPSHRPRCPARDRGGRYLRPLRPPGEAAPLRPLRPAGGLAAPPPPWLARGAPEPLGGGVPAGAALRAGRAGGPPGLSRGVARRRYPPRPVSHRIAAALCDHLSRLHLVGVPGRPTGHTSLHPCAASASSTAMASPSAPAASSNAGAIGGRRQRSSAKALGTTSTSRSALSVAPSPS